MLCGGTMQAEEMGLLVHSGAGAPQSFALSSINKITFSGGNMNVLPTSGTGSNFAVSAISQLTFETETESPSTPTAIGAPEASALRFYPNPVRDELFVTSDTEIESIAVLALTGNVLWRTDVQATTARLSLGFLSAGTYVIQVKCANTVSSQKFIKN